MRTGEFPGAVFPGELQRNGVGRVVAGNGREEGQVGRRGLNGGGARRGTDPVVRSYLLSCHCYGLVLRVCGCVLRGVRLRFECGGKKAGIGRWGVVPTDGPNCPLQRFIRSLHDSRVN
jgi:hypothetical protein